MMTENGIQSNIPGEEFLENPSLMKKLLEKSKFSEKDYEEMIKICQRKVDEFSSTYYISEMRDIIENFSIQDFYQQMLNTDTGHYDDEIFTNEMICEELTNEIQSFYDNLEIGKAWFGKRYYEGTKHVYEGKHLSYVLELIYRPESNLKNESIHVKIGYYLAQDPTNEAWDTRELVVDGVEIKRTKDHFKKLVEVFRLKSITPFILAHLMSQIFYGFGDDLLYDSVYIGGPVNN